MTLISKIRLIGAICITAIGITVSPVYASGLLTAKGSKTELQIQDHKVNVAIEDGYAVTTVDNYFYNPTNSDLEAVYQFPVPKNGTIAEFTLWIDGQEVTGEVVEKQRAKQLYEQEREAGRDAGLAVKKSFYNFETHVSPVRAGQVTRTRIVYLQPADIEGGIGRYVYPLQDGGTDQSQLNFWQSDDKVHGDFNFDLTLRSGFPVDALRSPAHPQAQITQNNEQHWNLSIGNNGNRQANPIAAEESTANVAKMPERDAAFSDLEENQPTNSAGGNTLNQDIVVYWRLRPDLPGAIELVAHREPGERRGTFMLSVTPGIDLEVINEGRDWVFVLDRSGSMSGKYQTLMDATAQALKQLGSRDRFKIILFSNRVELLTKDWVSADQISIEQVERSLRQSQVDGGTDLYAGLHTAIKQLDSDRTSGIVLVTDGVANVGKTEKKDFIDLLTQQDVRLFTAIMGNGANRPLLDSMTKVSGGFASSVSNSDDIMGVLLGATEKVKYQALHDVELSIHGLRTADLVPAQTTTLYRGQQMVMFGHYYGDDEAEVVLKAKISGEKKEYRSRFSFPKEATSNPEVERLWAYASIQDIKDRANYLGVALEDHRSAIIDTATEFGLVTDFTSMLVMSDAQFEQHGIERNNRDRRLTEKAAASARAASPVQSNRVDQSSPAFTGNQSHYSSNSSSNSGSGASGPFLLLLLVPLLFARIRKSRSSNVR